MPKGLGSHSGVAEASRLLRRFAVSIGKQLRADVFRAIYLRILFSKDTTLRQRLMVFRRLGAP